MLVLVSGPKQGVPMELRRSIARKLMAPHNWRSFFGLVKTTRHPISIAASMYFAKNHYPKEVALYTPTGGIDISLRSREDLKTLNEVFFRQDYPCRSTDRVFVDFGGNIGISAAYFLSRHQENIVYVYEPVPFNIGYAKRNLRIFSNRVELLEKAVALNDGKVKFGIEASGRYCGIGCHGEETIEVSCCTASAELTNIIAKHGQIDLLKIDIEGMEIPVLQSISEHLLCYISRILAECDGSLLCLPNFSYQQYLSVAYFIRDI
jgi:FkbM family methyltransferase